MSEGGGIGLKPIATSASPQDRVNAVRMQEAATKEVEIIRRTASSWVKGLGAILVAVLGFSLIKGPSEVTSLAGWAPQAVGFLLLLALVFGAVATGFLFRAAYGSTRALSGSATEHEEARSSGRALNWGLGIAGAALLALVSAVGVTWYGPTDPDVFLEVIDGEGHTWCGQVLRVDAGDLTLDADGMEIILPMSALVGLAPQDECRETG